MSRKHIALLYFGFALVVLGLTVVVLQRAGVSRTFVENLLADVLVRDRFRLGDANLHLGEGKLTLDAFELSTSQAGEHKPFVAVDRIELDVDTNPLGDVGRIRQARVSGLALELDLSDGHTPDLSELFEQTGELESDGAPPPAITITDSRVTLRFAPDAEAAVFTDVDLQLLPEEIGSHRMVLTGSMMSPAGLRTAVRGTGDFRTNQFRAVMTIEEFPLDPTLATRFAPRIGAMLDEARLRGTAESLSLWIEYSEDEANGAQLDAGANINVSDLSGIPPAVPYRLAAASTNITVSTRNNGTVRFELTDPDTSGDVHAKGLLTECFSESPVVDVEFRAEDMLIRPELTDALRELPVVSRVLDAFEPTSGRVDAVAQVRSSRDDRPPRVDLDLEFEDVTMHWHGIPTRSELRPIEFPEPATNAHGRIRLRGRELFLDGIQFDSCGARSELTAAIELDESAPLSIEWTAADIPFSARARDAIASLAPGAVTFYDQASPEGRTRAHVRLSRVQDGPLVTIVRLRPLEASASWADFPYRVSKLTGSIDIEPDAVAIDLRGEHGSAPVDLHGRFLATERDGPLGTELWIKADRLALDNELQAAVGTLGASFRDTWHALGPEGRASCELTLWKPPGDADLDFDVRVDAVDATLTLEAFGIPIRGVTGPVFVHGTGAESKIDVGVLRAFIDNDAGTAPADLVIHGVGATSSAGTTLEITSTVDNLQLNDVLRDALDESGAFEGAAWDVLAPSGYVSLVAHQRLDPGRPELEHQLSIQLDGVNSHAEMLPSPALGMTGNVTIIDGTATYRDLRATVGKSIVVCESGSASHDGTATIVRAIVSSDDFPFDDSLANLVTGPVRQTFIDRRPRGSLDVQHLDLRFRFPDATESFTLEVRGRIGLRRAGLSLGADIRGLGGTIHIDRARFDDEGGLVEGQLEGGTLTIAGHRVGRLSLAFHADAEQVRFRNVSGRFHDGELFSRDASHPTLQFRFDEQRLEADLGWRNLSLSSVVRANGNPDSDYRGNVSGWIRVDELIGDDLIHATARGQVRISEGRLGKVPLFTSLYSHLAPNERPQFDGLRIDFELADRNIDITTIEATSSLLSVSGQGSLTTDGYLDMELDVADLFGEDADWLVLPVFARVLTTGVIKFQVYGYLRAPRARPQWLWEPKPDRVRLGPIPGRLDDPSQRDLPE